MIKDLEVYPAENCGLNNGNYSRYYDFKHLESWLIQDVQDEKVGFIQFENSIIMTNHILAEMKNGKLRSKLIPLNTKELSDLIEGKEENKQKWLIYKGSPIE